MMQKVVPILGMTVPLNGSNLVFNTYKGSQHGVTYKTDCISQASDDYAI